MTDWTTATDVELAENFEAIFVEQTKRQRIASAEQQTAAINDQYLIDTGVTGGDPWRQPTGAHDAYPMDWLVSHEDKTWRSLVSGNVWEPGVANWREEASGNEWPDWVQPTGAHDAYDVGAKVTHAEKHWINDVEDNVWVPGEYGWIEQ